MDKALAAEIFTGPAIEALRAFQIEPRRIELVSVSENVTFRVGGEGDGYALRLHRPGYHTIAELESEPAWTRALVAAGVAAPLSVPAPDGRYYVPVAIPATRESRYAGVVRWAEGEILDEVMRRDPDTRALSPRFEQLGSILAAMHDQASAWRPPARFTRHHLDREGLMGEAPFWGRFWEHPALTREERDLMTRTREKIREALGRYGQAAERYSLIHADLHPGNILIDGARLGVIDFDDAGFGWHMYDAAVCLVRQQTHAHFPAVRDALFRGYRSVRALSQEDEATLPMFLLIRGMAQIGWLGQRPELTGPEHTDYLAHIRDVVRAQCEAFERPC
jgi:Ser/Thr protein kinase RdoA (MazF antagonist)